MLPKHLENSSRTKDPTKGSAFHAESICGGMLRSYLDTLYIMARILCFICSIQRLASFF